MQVGSQLNGPEQEELEELVQRRTEFAHLPERAKWCMGNAEKNYKAFVTHYAIGHQLRWKANALVRHYSPNEKLYYDDLLRYSREHLMLYPYHLSDIYGKGLRITAFKYYLDMMQDVMKSERSYDSLPNFTATDCVRLLGIGRNQFIDIMNTMRAKSWLWKKRRNAIYELLPVRPAPSDIHHWWVVHLAFVSEEDARNASKQELVAINMLIELGHRKAGEMDKSMVHELHSRGLVYIDVPVADDDCITIPPLEGFVMNRVLGDYFENLLYKLFVSVDEHTTIKQLAQILQVDINMVKQAISMYIRLGFAKKQNVEELIATTMADDTSFIMNEGGAKRTRWHSSWLEDAQAASNNAPPQSPSVGMTSKDQLFNLDTGEIIGQKRIAFMFDSTITAYLMMGNLGVGLKTHAVTMFERGKLSDESLESFLSELDMVNPEAEGEAQTYVDHALALKHTLHFLRYNKEIHGSTAENGYGVDLIRYERINSLDESTKLRLLDKNYALIICMAPITQETQNTSRVIPRFFGPAMPEVNSVWFQMYLFHLIGSGPPSVLYPKGHRVTKLPKFLQPYSKLQLSTWNHDPTISNSQYVLLTLNDALALSPVYIQAYTMYDDADIINIAFPIDFNEPYKPNATIAKRLERHPSVVRVHKLLRLQHSLGYISLIKTGHVVKKKVQRDENAIDAEVMQAKNIIIPKRTRKTMVMQPTDSPFGVSIRQVELAELQVSLERKLMTSLVDQQLLRQSAQKGENSQLNAEDFDEDVGGAQKKEKEQEKATEKENEKETEAEVETKTETMVEKEKETSEGFKDDIGALPPLEDPSISEENAAPKETEKEKLGSAEDEESVQEEWFEEWTITNVRFGIPLFDTALALRICDKIADHKLLLDANVAAHNMNAGRISNAVLDFVEAHQAQGYKFSVEPGILPYPTRSVLCPGYGPIL